MIKFTWEYTGLKRTGKKYISWSAEWDGRWDNDPLLSESEKETAESVFGHPFNGTVDWEQQEQTYHYYNNMTDDEKKKEKFITVLEDDGSTSRVNMGTSENINPEDYNPKKLMSCGDTVAVNAVTRALCEVLSDSEKIKMGSGNTHAYSYRTNLLICLSRLWD